ncbi:endonuclease/exonuclease/phosphatase family protein [Nocardioides sambongensis]|uniref:endonuclease/exonuclease/phosphatase family protein n=1 Tax=Nocardioides sambongensis TaxID=2589074 RepID=UPI0011273B5D|nr:endonuclease/exonuclease/phosphatase family protein [Nocardioides sambongensis]
MDSDRTSPEQSPWLLLAGFAVIAGLVLGAVRLAGGDEDRAGSAPGASGPTSSATAASPTGTAGPSASAGGPADRGDRYGGQSRVKVPPNLRDLDPVPRAPSSRGRSGSGLALGPPTDVDAPIGLPVQGQVTTAVANIPNRTSSSGFAASMATLTSASPDFLLLNEVSRRSTRQIAALAPGYGVYRDPVPDRSPGGVQSMNNVIAWREDSWHLVDGGRIKIVDNDVGYLRGRAFVWDRYATWGVLQHQDGAIVSVISTHMMTNPVRAPRQPGSPGQSRLQRYAAGMDRLTAAVRTLAAHGPVLLGGDMNSHPDQGRGPPRPSWAPPASPTPRTAR